MGVELGKELANTLTQSSPMRALDGSVRLVDSWPHRSGAAYR